MYFQRSVAGLAGVFYWLSGFLATKVFPLLVLSFGLSAIFVGISCTCLASVVFTILVVPETRLERVKKVSVS